MKPNNSYIPVNEICFSIYMNDLKQAPEPSAWPHMIKNLNGIVQYRISVEVSKYGQCATSEEILLELPTLGKFLNHIINRKWIIPTVSIQANWILF